MFGFRKHLLTVVAVVIAVSITAAVPLVAGTDNSTWVKGGWKDGPVALPADYGKIAALPLRKGKYAVSAKLWFWNDSGHVLVSSCRLTLGDSSDYVLEETPNIEHEAIELQVVGTLDRNGRALLECKDTRANGGVTANWIKMTAVKASQLRNVPLK